jgi:hypothetical protein
LKRPVLTLELLQASKHKSPFFPRISDLAILLSNKKKSSEIFLYKKCSCYELIRSWFFSPFSSLTPLIGSLPPKNNELFLPKFRNSNFFLETLSSSTRFWPAQICCAQTELGTGQNLNKNSRFFSVFQSQLFCVSFSARFRVAPNTPPPTPISIPNSFL